MNQAEVQKKLVVDSVCEACKGTGRRGRGKCRKCEGKGVADLCHPRLRFNWGYHDGASDQARGKARTVVSEGPQNPSQVSEQFDWWYAKGYADGLKDQADGVYQGDSLITWKRLTGLTTRSA